MIDRKKTESQVDDTGLEAFFDAARVSGEAPSEALLAAILRDAEAAQPDPPGLPKAAPAQPRRWLPRADWLGIGGWQTAAILGVSLVLGAVLGYTPPAALEPLTSEVLGGTGMVQATEYYMLDDMLAEG